MTKECNLKVAQKVFYLQQNKIASCCRAYPEALDPTKTLNDYIDRWQTESKQLQQGQELVGCETCWYRERQQLPSLRTESLNAVPANKIELYLSNACNQQCSYCSPKFSSEWESDIKKFGTFERVSASSKTNQQIAQSSDNYNYWLDQVNQYLLDQPADSVSLTLLGGEPLMQRSNLETLLSLNSSKIKVLEIVTNLNPPNNKFLKYILNTVDKSKLMFSISIDSAPTWNHVPRAKFNASKFEENFKILKEHSINYRFFTVLSVLNIFDIGRYLNWTEIDRQVWNVLSNPVCLDVTAVPKKWRKQIWETLKNPPLIIEHQLLSETEPVDIILFEQYNYLKQYFQRVGIEPTKLDNQLFVDYWLFLESKFK